MLVVAALRLHKFVTPRSTRWPWEAYPTPACRVGSLHALLPPMLTPDAPQARELFADRCGSHGMVTALKMEQAQP